MPVGLGQAGETWSSLSWATGRAGSGAPPSGSPRGKPLPKVREGKAPSPGLRAPSQEAETPGFGTGTEGFLWAQGWASVLPTRRARRPGGPLAQSSGALSVGP